MYKDTHSFQNFPHPLSHLIPIIALWSKPEVSDITAGGNVKTVFTWSVSTNLLVQFSPISVTQMWKLEGKKRKLNAKK